MAYRVHLKRLLDGSVYARCPGAPYGLAETQGASADEALQKMREKIRYLIEWCPCSGVAEDFVQLEVVEHNGNGGVYR